MKMTYLSASRTFNDEGPEFTFSVHLEGDSIQIAQKLTNEQNKQLCAVLRRFVPDMINTAIEGARDAKQNFLALPMK